jgi:hypothetical protein
MIATTMPANARATRIWSWSSLFNFLKLIIYKCKRGYRVFPGTFVPVPVVLFYHKRGKIIDPHRFASGSVKLKP